MTNPSTNADDRSERNADRLNGADELLDADERSSPILPGDLTAVVVERAVGPDECTIYPEGASDDDLVTEWMTAEEGSYVELESMR